MNTTKLYEVSTRKDKEFFCIFECNTTEQALVLSNELNKKFISMNASGMLTSTGKYHVVTLKANASPSYLNRAACYADGFMSGKFGL